MQKLAPPTPVTSLDHIFGRCDRIFGEGWKLVPGLQDTVGLRGQRFIALLAAVADARTGRHRHAAVFHALRSFDARFCALILSWPKSADAIGLEAAELMAASLNARGECNEPVETYLAKKPEGGKRRIWVSGPKRRALQCLAKLVLMAIWGPSKFEFAQRGRGRDAAMRLIIYETEKKGGARWFLTADITNCFGSFNRDQLLEIIPLPRAVIESCIFIMEGTEVIDKSGCYTSDTAVLSGLPQGSLASLYIASKMLEGVLRELTGIVKVSHVDDILVGTKTQEEAAANEHRLGVLLAEHPAGPLFMKSSIQPLGKPIDFLGYRLVRKWIAFGGGVRAIPSQKAFARVIARVKQKLANKHPHETKHEIVAQYVGNWFNAQRSWDRSRRARQKLDGFVQSELPLAIKPSAG